MDPLAFAVLCGIGSGTVGFILGGSLFNMTWKIIFKKRSRELLKVCAYYHVNAAMFLYMDPV